MTETIIQVDGLSKRYDLGTIGTGTFYGDFSKKTAKWFGKQDPYAKIGESEKKTKSFWALEDVSFQLNRGDVLGIIGKNGAGKSTLLKILSRTTSPTRGHIKIYGTVASLLEVGTGFHPELTGRENIFLNGAILGMTKSEIRKRFDEMVDFAGVEKFIDTPVKRYSSGMYVRLAFAVAAHLEPDVLIVDEVLAVGDIEFQKKCIGKMQDVSKNEGRTVLFVSHNFGAIETLCKTGIHLDAGKLIFNGDVKDALQSFHQSSLTQIKQFSILERTDRSGSGGIKFVQVSIHDSESNPVSFILSGQHVFMKVELENYLDYSVQNFQIDIGINTKLGEPLIWLSSSLSNIKITMMPGRNTVQVEIPSMALTPGEYQLTLFCKANGEIFDSLTGAFPISITTGDFYNNGRLPSVKYGHFMIKHEFN